MYNANEDAHLNKYKKLFLILIKISFANFLIIFVIIYFFIFNFTFVHC